MRIIKEILGRILALWGLIFFFVSMLIMLPVIWATDIFAEPKRTACFIKIAKGWMRTFLFCIGCPVSAKGKENFKKGETYIVLCNHNSLLDVPLSSPEIPGANKTIAKVELSRIPLFGIIYKKGSVLVDRRKDNSRRKSIEDMKKVLLTEMHMCIYPEGTRNLTGKPLKEFYDGAFKLAVDTKKPIIPALIFNTKKAFPADKFFFLWPHKLSIHFLPPVFISDDITYKQLKQDVYDIMEKYYVEHSK